MDEPPKDPGSRELLQRIRSLEADNAQMKARYDDLAEAFKSHIDGNLHEFDRIGDLLWAVAHKVFPNLGDMLGKMNAVIPPRYVNPSIDRRPGEHKAD